MLSIVISVMTEAVGCWTLGTEEWDDWPWLWDSSGLVLVSDSAAGSPQLLSKVLQSDNRILAAFIWAVFHAVLVSISFYLKSKAYISSIGIQLSLPKDSSHARTKLVYRLETLDRHSYVHRRNGSYNSKCIPWAANSPDLWLLSSDLSHQDQQGNGRQHTAALSHPPKSQCKP